MIYPAKIATFLGWTDLRPWFAERLEYRFVPEKACWQWSSNFMHVRTLDSQSPWSTSNILLKGSSGITPSLKSFSNTDHCTHIQQSRLLNSSKFVHVLIPCRRCWYVVHLQVFDKLLLLQKGGETVYFGDLGQNSTTLIDYFETNGSRKCHSDENPCVQLSLSIFSSLMPF